MENLVIEARLVSPIIMQGHLTFDSLLGALAHEKLGDWSKIPVKQSDGLFHASSAITDPFAKSSVGWAASMRWQHDWPVDLMPLNSRGTPQALSAKRKREFGQVLSGYKVLHTERIRWNVCGDRERISALIRDVKAIGKKRAQGYGHVEGWVYRLASEDHSIVGPEGQPMRPVPHDMFDGDKSLPMTEAAWRPAYHDPRNRAACYAPRLH
ncbi:hypothetical protein HKCCSP123_14105 [Rhodobacterales bacterium HKCCSP123]|nr:hypothetical protein [Rhodobacterales bacterium HKCCSP123]